MTWCEYCRAQVDTRDVDLHEQWHAVNDLHAPHCGQVAPPQPPPEGVDTPCTCGLVWVRARLGLTT